VGGGAVHLSKEVEPLFLKGRHLVLYGAARHTRFDGLDEPANLAFRLL
jgi:hypothetical protein